MCMTCAFINPFGGDFLHEGEPSRTINEGDTPGGEVPGNTGTTVELEVGDTFNGSLNAAFDWDWFEVDFVQGETYEIVMTPGTLDDPLLWLLDGTGNTIEVEDSAFSGGTETIVWTATYTGTGYIAADSYYNNGGAGGFTDTGTYSVTLNTTAPPPPSTPLDAIDWNYTAPSTINVYFVPGGTTFDDQYGPAQGTGTWSAFEQQQAELAFDMFEAVANVTFNIVTDPNQADFFMVESTDADSAFGYWGVGGGSPSVGGTTYNNLDGWGVFYNGAEESGAFPEWSDDSLEQGGFGFVLLLHEIGHGMGLAHPHDTGGGSEVMTGVTGAFNSLGLFDLNQGINTTMTYNDGWQTAPFGVSPSLDYGLQGSLMAFDIAVLQATYGANMTTNTGDDTYTLLDSNAPGTFYSAIWDAGGDDDEIVYSGNRDATIDLRAAPLTYDFNGGGFVSYVQGIHGGFTIAAGVVIEHASGGSGDDTLTGNDADNTLMGNNGRDELNGAAGDDSLNGGSGNDTMDGGGDDDTLSGENGRDSMDGGAGDDHLMGGDGNDSLNGGDDNDTLEGEDGNDDIDGGDGVDVAAYSQNRDDYTVTDLGNGEVRVASSSGNDTVSGVEFFSFADGIVALSELLNASSTQNSILVDLTLAGQAAGFGLQDIEGLLDGLLNDAVIQSGFSTTTFTAVDGATSFAVNGTNLTYGTDANGTFLSGGTVTSIVVSVGGVVAGTLTGSINAAQLSAAAFAEAAGIDNTALEDFFSAVDWSYNGSSVDDQLPETLTSIDGIPFQFNGEDSLNLGGGNDSVYLADGNDFANGQLGDDTIGGGMGNDTILGDGGNDVLSGDAGEDSLVGGLDNDSLYGGGDADDMQGDEGEDLLSGGGGNDVMEGGDDGDTLNGGAGFDTMNGGEGADVMNGNSNVDSMDGGGGDDTMNGNTGGDRMVGGAGDDSLVGSFGDDLIRGQNDNDTLDGNGGADRLFGDNGDDLLNGGNGNDTMLGGADNDTLNGGGNSDNLSGGSGNDALNGGDGLDVLDGGGGEDTLNGGEGRDVMAGGSGDDTLEGEGGDDRMLGGNGSDILNGGAGTDELIGNAGFDTLTGGADNDTMTGGGNADVFVFADGHGVDTITDFEATNNGEKIDLSAVNSLNAIADITGPGGAASTVTGGVEIDTGGGNSIFLQGVTLGDLDGADFLF